MAIRVNESDENILVLNDGMFSLLKRFINHNEYSYSDDDPTIAAYSAFFIQPTKHMKKYFLILNFFS